MKKLWGLLPLLAVFTYAPPLWALGGSVNPSPSAAPSSPVSNSSGPASSGSSGESVFFGSGVSLLDGQAGVALEARLSLARDFSVELAGTVVHPVSGYPQAESQGNTDYTESFGEAHAALRYRFYQTGPLSFDAGAGAAVGVVRDHLSEASPSLPPTIFEDRRILPSPILILGARCRLTDTFSILADVSYVDFVSHIAYGPIQSFNLTVSGPMARFLIEARL